jgi:hypothetical protein
MNLSELTSTGVFVVRAAVSYCPASSIAVTGSLEKLFGNVIASVVLHETRRISSRTTETGFTTRTS